MTEEIEEGPEDADTTRYPLTMKDKLHIDAIIAMVRGRLGTMSPKELRAASSVLFGLERLPHVEDELAVNFGFTFRDGGNFAWADIDFSSDGFRLGVGEHFYDPGVGGDTESRSVFYAAPGDDRDGSIEEWLEIATGLSDGSLSCEDYTDHDALDWSLADDPSEWEPTG